MKIFKPLCDEDYEVIALAPGETYLSFFMLDGQPRREIWKPIKVRRVKARPREIGRASDFPWMLSSHLVMSRAAVEALHDILDAHGEVLPLATDDDVELFVYNARVVDALDEVNSTLFKIPNTDRINYIKKVVFVKSAIQGLNIFRLSRYPNTTYVSERFIERVNRANLRGLVFNEVWSG